MMAVVQHVPWWWDGAVSGRSRVSGCAELLGRRASGALEASERRTHRQEFLMNTLRGGNPMNADLVKLPNARPSAEGLSKLESAYRHGAFEDRNGNDSARLSLSTRSRARSGRRYLPR